MNEIQDYFIRNDLPESLNRENTKELAQLTDAVLHNFDGKILGALIYPAIDNLPSDLIDALAVQLHCDFYDSRLPLETRRKLVKSSIAWHRIKGTPAAVETLLQTLFRDAHVSEWFEYGGRPYFFRVKVDISNTEEGANPDTMARVKKIIELGKNVRSWLDLLEFQIHIKDDLEITEDRWWIVQIAQCAKDIYPWRGRFFDTSWTFAPPVAFDGTWFLDGEYHFDDVPAGAEDAAGNRFAFDGDWWFDGARRFGYPVSRKVLWGTAEPDELEVSSRIAAKEKYTVQLPFDALTPFDKGWAFGARDGPQDAGFSVGVGSALSEQIDPQDGFNSVIVVSPILRDIYPLARICSFDGAWYFREIVSYDGQWQFGGDPGHMYSGNRFEHWNHLPTTFFGESNETIETIYEDVNPTFDGSWDYAEIVEPEIVYKEVNPCFDGSWTFSKESVVRFGESVETIEPVCKRDNSGAPAVCFGKLLRVPRVAIVENGPYDGPIYDSSWKFFGLHDQDAFWTEDSQERFNLFDHGPGGYPETGIETEAENLQVQEEPLLQTVPEFVESILCCPVFDGSWQYEGISHLGTSDVSFEASPVFGEGRCFDDTWAFEMCSRAFDGTWSLGDDPLHFDGDWHFGGEMYFATNDIPEEAGETVHACLSERAEHHIHFGINRAAFDGLWDFGRSAGMQEAAGTFAVSVAPLQDKEEPQENSVASISVAIKEDLPIVLPAVFDGGWNFGRQLAFDNGWTFRDGPTFNGAAADVPAFNEEQTVEYLHVDDVPDDNDRKLFDSICRANAFDGTWRFDGSVVFSSNDIVEAGFFSSRSVIKEQHTVQLPFDALPPFSEDWNFGAKDGLQEAGFTVDAEPVLPENLDLQDAAAAAIRPVFREVYPLARIRNFDGTWYFREVIPFDGLWQLGEDPGYRYQDNRFEPWNHLPMSFFNEDTEAIYDGSWFFGLHDADAFWEEDSQERFRITNDEPETENLQVQEGSSLQAGAGIAESILPCTDFDGSWQYDGVSLFGTSDVVFESLPGFGENRNFDNSWGFEMCSRAFDGTWSLGDDPLHFDGDWHFGGEMYFATNDIPEKANANVHVCLSERLEHTSCFGVEKTLFDGEWTFGKTNGMSEGLEVSIASVIHFDDTWAFDDEPRRIDGTWSLGIDDYAFGDNTDPRNSYDGSWNFTDSMNTRIRFERRWRSFGSITFAA